MADFCFISDFLITKHPSSVRYSHSSNERVYIRQKTACNELLEAIDTAWKGSWRFSLA